MPLKEAVIRLLNETTDWLEAIDISVRLYARDYYGKSAGLVAILDVIDSLVAAGKVEVKDASCHYALYRLVRKGA
jgi:hypothetical protein